jgi:hypothetical protein
VRRLQTIVWAVAGALSTASFVTKAPFSGVVPAAIVGASAILPGLAVAVIARFQSLPVALVAGIASASPSGPSAGTSTPSRLRRHVPRRDPRRPARAEDEAHARRVGGEQLGQRRVLKPIPRELRHVAEVRWVRRAIAGSRCSSPCSLPLR